MICTIAPDVDFEEYTLIIPTPCVGNVGQLALDVLIASVNDIEETGYIGHESVLPFASGIPFGHVNEEVCASMEVYRCVRSKVVLIQIRSSLISKKCEEEFANELVKWIINRKISKVVILTGVHAYQKLDCQAQEPRVRYVASSSAKESFGQQLSTLDCKELEPQESHPCQASDPYPALKGQGFFYGASYAKCLFSKCVENSIPSVIFMTFSAESDNTPEAIVVAEICDGLVPIVPVDVEGKKLFKTPPSWTHFSGNYPPP